jgi:iron complex outermembrane receptor protein
MEVLMKRHLQQYTLLVTCGVFLFLSIASTPSNQSLASDQNADLTELTLEALMDIEVVTPSRIIENAKKSASSITVITDKQIEQMGVRNLMDVIQTVPGMNYFYTLGGTYTIYSMGRPSIYSQRVLLMVNSHPLAGC